MESPGTSPPKPPHDTPKVYRARSLPIARPYRMAVLFSAIHYLGIIATFTALACFLGEPTEATSRVLLTGMAFSAATWFIAFFKRRSVCCPLCKGTPLINSGARVHARAKRLPPLNHGVTAVISVLVSHKFRCMYCATEFDLLKPPARLLHGPETVTDNNPPATHDNLS